MGMFQQSEYVGIEGLGFRVYEDEEIKKISVLRITSPETFNQLGHISANGLYDLRLGPIEHNDDLCGTCRLSSFDCAGHCGHIELPLPVYNPFFYDALKKIVSHMCFTCNRFLAKKEKVMLISYQKKLIEKGFAAEALDLVDLVSQVIACTKEMEAEEVELGVDDKAKKKKKKAEAINASTLHALSLKLDSHVSNIISSGTCQDLKTSNVNAVQEEMHKKFWVNSNPRKHCSFCGCVLFKLSLQGSRFMKRSEKVLEVDPKEESLEDVIRAQSFLTPRQIQGALRKCWKQDSDVLGALFPIFSSSKLKYPTDVFFLKTLLVIPPKFRPYTRQFDGFISEHESCPILKNVIKLCTYMVPLISVMNGTLEEVPSNLTKFYLEIKGESTEEKCQNMWYQIQCNIDNLYDSDLNSTKQVTTKGIRQVIEKKKGLMRCNIMGKRVNFSARSVAAPDPYLAIDEVGVPKDFAIKLSYPVPVTEWNVEEMRKLVINGANKYPGAVLVEDEEGKKIRLFKLDETQRIALANKLLTPVESHVRKVNAQKIVHRQLKNGDYVLMNRQPTLHRPSIQAHRVRVMEKDRVLRMPYANCKAYNADFDGDEFNMHFPQNELARSESKHLIMTHNQYLTPKDGSPLAGLIQDSVVSSVKITMRGTFFNREDYQQLVYSSLPDHKARLICLPPCIMKPQELWSGKQVLSTLIHNIVPSQTAKPSFIFKTSVKADIWQTNESRPWRAGGKPEKKKEAMSESEFVMRDGELLSGVVDKSAIGSTSHGLIHTCYDLYGGTTAYKLLTAVNRMCVYYLQWAGHTITAKDFLTPIRVSKKRRKDLKALLERAPNEVAAKLNLSEEDFKDYFEQAHMSCNDKNMAAIDGAYTSVLGPTTSRVTAENERQLLRANLDNQMKMMVDTGAKGSKVNMNQMASLFGSVAIDGKRMPLSITGKSLPSFKSYDSDPCAGGYIPNRFMTGINPKSYFFLCIVGRDSLQHTAVKTANSGYVQRCLIKHLEGIRVDYDMTVRNSDGLVLQFNYGEDGLDPIRVPFMSNPATLDVLVTNYSRLIDDFTLTTAEMIGEQEKVKKYMQKSRKVFKKQLEDKQRHSGFLKFCRKVNGNYQQEGFCHKTGRTNTSKHLVQLWYNLPDAERKKYCDKVQRMPDPVDSVFSSASNLGVVSEALDDLIEQYYNDMYSKRRIAEQKLSKDEVKRTVHMKALMSKVDPGEAVGAICAQALGEPLTQMTLNTFHFAGKDELNVTLGVPRMIEILRTGGKKISTPIMEVPFHPHVTKRQAEKLRLMLSEVALSKVLQTMNVVSSVTTSIGSKSRLDRILKVKLSFLPYKEYKHFCAVRPSDILKYVEKYFLMNVLNEIFRRIKKQRIYCSTNLEKKKNDDTGEDNLEEEEGHVNLDLNEDNPNEGSDSDDDDDDNRELQDNDADAASKAKRGKEQDYSDDEEEEEEEEEDGDGDATRQQVEENETIIEEEMNVENVVTEPVVGDGKKKKYAVSEQEAEQRIEILKGKAPNITDYNFDREKQLWCEVEYMLPLVEGAYDIVSIVKELSEHAFVSHVKGIRRVFVVEKDDTLMLRTEGVNVLKMYAYEHLLNVNKLYTNNIHDVAEMYGIEAAQRSVIREIRAVQSAYDIKVNFRHLSLLSDYFTCEGKYKACSRASITTCASPIQKMSFETCSHFIKCALLQGEKDNMDSPSSNIAVGQPPKVGTNTMEIRHAYNKMFL